MSDDELPDLASIIRLPAGLTKPNRSTILTASRRSPRKHKATTTITQPQILEDAPEIFLSSQQRASPRKLQLSTRDVLQPTQGKAVSRSKSTARNKKKLEGDYDTQSLRGTIPRLLDNTVVPRKSEQRSDGTHFSTQTSRIPRTARQQKTCSKTTTRRNNPYISKEAHCEDLDESSGTDGEDEDTDLDGFIVDDDADLSFYDSADELEIQRDRRKHNQKEFDEEPKVTVRRTLVRGREKQSSPASDDGSASLTDALNNMKLGAGVLEKQRDTERRQTIEVIDLTSSPVQEHSTSQPESDSHAESIEEYQGAIHNPFANLEAIRLQPTDKSQPRLLLPSKSAASKSVISNGRKSVEAASTTPQTPPRSPSKTKLKSPVKLFSPEKRAAHAPASPSRPSLDAFWDHNVINQWNDTYSPKKAPILSPRRNPLSRFTLEVKDDVFQDNSSLDSSQRTSTSVDNFDDSSDSLPSPSESPSKSRSPSKISALKAEQARLRQEKKARLEAKKKFDAEKHTMAVDLVLALDEHLVHSKISAMSASTGGIKIFWSKTLRSTAGRANWKRTITKPSGSPIKGDPNSRNVEQQPGVIVKHFASIELAEKIIDRPERLFDTLAHEFCHLANFMISGIRDQPHGESFKRWARKVTSWMKSDVAHETVGWRQEWSMVEVTTKHSYVVETKYLWVCTGRPAQQQKQSLAMKMLNIEPEDEEGCGAEYGRHSKSIDVDKQRCGRCKGFLVQVRPVPRAPASPRKMSPKKKAEAPQPFIDGDENVGSLGKLLEVIDLDD